MLNFSLNKSLKYNLSVDYGEEITCPIEDPCYSVHKCTQIFNARILKISPYQALQFAGKEFCDGDEKERALTFMFFRHCFDEDDFEISTWSGYYGEEIDDVRLTDSGRAKIARFNMLVADNDVRSILAMIFSHHYGYILPEVLDNKHWIYRTLSTKDVIVSEQGRRQVNESLYSGLDDRNLPNWYPGCVVIPKDNLDGIKYKIIDGFHRWQHFNSKKKRLKVGVLCPC